MANPKPVSDPVIDEVRAVRSRISAQFDHDPMKLVEHYMELQKRHGDRLLESPKLSEAALAEDWNRPEEDAAWSHLQPEKSRSRQSTG
jgi:hypothetical protein